MSAKVCKTEIISVQVTLNAYLSLKLLSLIIVIINNFFFKYFLIWYFIGGISQLKILGTVFFI